jgi:DNA-binding MarR family transcriptional regulator
MMPGVPGPAEERLFELMKRLRKLGLDAYPSDQAGISPAQMALLDRIAGSPGCGIGAIAETLGLTPPTVSVGVRKLEESGLVERKPNPQDGRAIRFYLTRRGQAVEYRIRESFRRKFRLLLAGLSEGESETLLEILGRALDRAEGKRP